MTINIKPLAFKAHKLRGLSRHLMDTHYEVHYGEAVRYLNAIIAPPFEALDANDTTRPHADRLSDVHTVTAENTVLLHEIFFGALTEEDTHSPHPLLLKALQRDFGGFDAWQEQTRSLAHCLRGGSGWILLTWSRRRERLVNLCVHDHAQHPAQSDIVMAIDMYEHAYLHDFDSNTDAYVDAYFNNINWQVVNARYLCFTQASSNTNETHQSSSTNVEALKLAMEANPAMTVLDVRMEDDLRDGDLRIDGSLWMDPEKIDSWATKINKDEPVVVYCMYGGWVSKQAAETLRELGYDAQTLDGGISSWSALDLPSKKIDEKCN